MGSGTVVRQQFVNRPVTTPNPQWQPAPRPPATVQPGPVTPVEASAPRTPTFTAALLPAPPLPPEHIVTEQDRQTQQQYERWLHHQNNILSQQLKFYETEVQKLRKIRKVGVEDFFNLIISVFFFLISSRFLAFWFGL